MGGCDDTSFAYNNLNQLKTLTPPSTCEQSVSYVTGGQSNLKHTRLDRHPEHHTRHDRPSQRIRHELLHTHTHRQPHRRAPPQRKDYNPIYDANGDIIGLLNTTGELVQTIRYGPYDENTNATGTLTYTTTNDPFLYQSGYHLPGANTGTGNIPNDLYHYGARYYDPTTGRWTQQDPVNQTGSATQGDAYGFAGGDPVNVSDRSGTLGSTATLQSAVLEFMWRCRPDLTAFMGASATVSVWTQE